MKARVNFDPGYKRWEFWADVRVWIGSAILIVPFALAVRLLRGEFAERLMEMLALAG